MLKIRKKIDKGFTLIELMITVAIVGILAVVALPAYQDYLVKSQVSEGLSLSGGAKVYITDFYTNKGRMPETSLEAGLPQNVGAYIADLKIEDYVVKVTFNSNANANISGAVLVLSPTLSSSNNIMFDCTTSIPKKYIPTTCRSIN